MNHTNETQPSGVGHILPALGKARVTRANRAAVVPKAPRKRRTMRQRWEAMKRREAQGG